MTDNSFSRVLHGDPKENIHGSLRLGDFRVRFNGKTPSFQHFVTVHSIDDEDEIAENVRLEPIYR